MSAIGNLLHDNTVKAKALTVVYDLLNDWHVKLGGTGGAALTGFIQGVKLSLNLTRMLVGNAKTVASSIGHFAASVVTFPFKMLRGLIEMADTGGSNELAQELEEIRKQFGFLKREAGGAIIDLSRSMKGELANTGLSVYRIFGTLVGRLQYFREYATKLGPLFDGLLTGSLKVGEGGAEALGAYNKALGLTDEGLKAVASRAFSSGKDINEINREIANYSLQLSKSFNVTTKTISREVGDMMADFQHFGHLGVRELTQVSVYARRLGVEVKALGGVMDKFMNFEDAAQGAAQLSQAFGLNVDALITNHLKF
jgi:methyl-accepting chemotaxis protein